MKEPVNHMSAFFLRHMSIQVSGVEGKSSDHMSSRKCAYQGLKLSAESVLIICCDHCLYCVWFMQPLLKLCHWPSSHCVQPF